VVFSFGVLLSAWHYARTPTAVSALTLGLCAGLMLATKETAGLALLAMVAAAALTRLAGHAGIRDAIQPQHAALAVVTAAGTCTVFFTSFFTHPQGLLDALRASSFYLDRASSSWHVHPWDYYLRLLIHFPAEGTPFWSEGLILGLALIGGFAAWFGPAAAPTATPESAAAERSPIAPATMLRFLSLYTLLLLALYSAIPYKTPWCVLSFLHGMALLAGSLFWGVLRRTPQAPPSLRGGGVLFQPVARTLGAVLFAAAALHLGWQAYAASFLFPADPRNPYVYAHTSTDVFEIVARVQALARVHPAGAAMPVQVISRENVWPLPFYLRRLDGVAWWTGVSDETKTAPVVLITPDMEQALVRKLYEVPPPGERELYVSIFDHPVWLRPGVEIRGYAARSLWEEHLQGEAAAP
jgi:hypothetical protein